MIRNNNGAFTVKYAPFFSCLTVDFNLDIVYNIYVLS